MLHMHLKSGFLAAEEYDTPAYTHIEVFVQVY